MLSSRFMLFQHLKKKLCKQITKIGGYFSNIFFKEKNTSFSFNFGLYAIFNIQFCCVEILKSAPSLTV